MPSQQHKSIDSYLICATPRTGSTLLCALLESTGVAGRPASYFRRQDKTSWAKRWGIDRSNCDHFLADYIRSAVAAGRTDNGVFAARIMWGTMDEVCTDLRQIHPEIQGTERELLQAAFGNTRFIYIHREDVIAQAISRLRAEQTQIWHRSDDGTTPRATTRPMYDFNAIHAYVEEILDHNRAWNAWFGSEGITPHSVSYDELVTRPDATISSLLYFLGLNLPSGVSINATNIRLADELNAQWSKRYRSELGIS